MSRKQSTARSRRRRAASAYREAALKRAAEALLGASVQSVEHPGGKSRESYRLWLASGESIIATRRDDISRARLEVRTLKALNGFNVAVPKLLGTNHALILLQQDIVGTRLSAALKDADENTTYRLLHEALRSLSAIQHAATEAGLEAHVKLLGGEVSWLQRLLDRPTVIGRYLDVSPPTLDRTRLIALLGVPEPRFVKWDARPGNALVDTSGRVVWFDWEHAGKRNRLDDLAWVLGDEFVPDYPQAEQRLLDEFVALVATGSFPVDPNDYLAAYGSFHILVRLGLILKYKDGPWWDIDECILHDKVGVTFDCASRLCTRGARWSARAPLTESLSPWFIAVRERLDSL